MLTLSGAPAVSDFRLQKLLAAIRDRVDHVTRLDSRYQHFSDLERDLAHPVQGRSAHPVLHGPADRRPELER
mgnify:CR=1 FL=1